VHAPSDVMQEWDAVCATEIKWCGEVLQRHRCQPVCHKYANADHCRFLFPHEIVDASSFDSKSNSVVLMCCNANVNYFNPYILVFCRHNHDIKCILSGRGAKAAMFYISEYITKMDVKTYEVLSLLSQAVPCIPARGQDVSPAESAKVLLHKCLSQFNGQHQVHAQQAVHYIQGFGDGIPSHETAPMLSSLLIGYVKDRYPWLKSGRGLPDIECDFGPESEEAEPVHIIHIATDNQRLLLEANQVHHYVHHAETLSHMNFYEFFRCVCLESISKNAKIKNTFETRLSVLHRHRLLSGHPYCETHILVEHTNLERGDGAVEHVPRVIGMSIPWPTNASLWAIFTLAHFKPFSISMDLFGINKDPITCHIQFDFCSRSHEVMKNWEAVHECEDERDADRLRKQVQLTTKSKALTASMGMGANEDDLDFTFPSDLSLRSENNFCAQQAILELQQSGWLDQQTVDPTTAASTSSSSTSSSSSNMTSDFPDNNEINRRIKQWKGEIKKQEQTITSTCHNALNPDQQLGVQEAPEMKQRQDMLEIVSESPTFVNVEYNQALCLPTETLAMAVISHTFALLIRSSGCQIQSDPIHRSVPDPLR